MATQNIRITCDKHAIAEALDKWQRNLQADDSLMTLREARADIERKIAEIERRREARERRKNRATAWVVAGLMAVGLALGWWMGA